MQVIQGQFAHGGVRDSGSFHLVAQSRVTYSPKVTSQSKMAA